MESNIEANRGIVLVNPLFHLLQQKYRKIGKKKHDWASISNKN